MEAIQIFEYQGKQIEFGLPKINMKINVTEMANIFGKRVDNFLASDATKAFIAELKSPAFQVDLGIKNDEDLIESRGRNGTWMHRVLALKFASWLDPKFEVWVFTTIDRIMFGDLRDDVKAKALAEAEEAALYQKMQAEVPDFAKYINLKSTISAYGGKIKKTQNTQLSIFKY